MSGTKVNYTYRLQDDGFGVDNPNRVHVIADNGYPRWYGVYEGEQFMRTFPVHEAAMNFAQKVARHTR